MKKITLSATLATVAVFTVQIQSAAACGISNVDGRGVLMLAGTLVFALAAGTVTLFAGQPQSEAADQTVATETAEARP
jgi:hypothetical protein